MTSILRDGKDRSLEMHSAAINVEKHALSGSRCYIDCLSIKTRPVTFYKIGLARMLVVE